MVEADLESRQPQKDSLGKQMRDPATAFPPLNEGNLASFGLVSDTRAPIETDKIEHYQNCGPPAVAEFTSHQILVYV